MIVKNRQKLRTDLKLSIYEAPACFFIYENLDPLYKEAWMIAFVDVIKNAIIHFMTGHPLTEGTE